MSPILMDAVTKARRSPNAPKTKAQAQRRLARYQRLADAAGDKPTGRIASAEAQRLQGVISGGKYGRGGTDGRTELERQRTAERKRTDRNNDGWIDGQKPKGAKPRKTATKAPADDLDPSSPNYRFKDTGYVAGSRKELAADMIRRSAKSGNRLRATDIDWKSLEQNPREAAAVITKSNLFGQVDWAKHRAEGMTPEAGFLIDRVYASVGKGPVNDTPQGRKDYALGLESLRDRLEKAKTADEVVAVVDGIREEMRGKMLTDADSKAIAAAVTRQRDAADKIAPLRAEMDAAYKAMSRAEGNVRQFEHEARKRERRGWKADPENTALLQTAQQSAEKLRADYTAIRDRVNPAMKALQEEHRSASLMIMAVESVAVARSADHPTKRAWNELGPRFAAVANFRSQKGSAAFRDHVTSAKVGRIKDWSWADQETMAATKERKESVRFQLQVADTHERIGGRAVGAASTADLKKQFNLREVQSGNWVLRDVAAAKFHTEQTAGALSDLADVIGAPDGEVSLNGRIALAFGARGTGNAGGSSARAHYESVQRVINLTKMSGGGSLAHEWFHALDNIVIEMEAARPAKASDFATENDGLPDGELKSAFKALNAAMMEGNVQAKRRFGYTANDVRLAVANVDRANYGLGLKIKQATTPEDAIAAVEAAFPERSLSRRGMKARRQRWLGIAAAHFGKKPDGGDIRVAAGPLRSRFAVQAERLDSLTASSRTYWAQPKEMAARAFQAYVEDRLAGQGRRNDYLSAKADNRWYRLEGVEPFPEGEERERINRAFDELFAALRRRGTLRKALSHGPFTIEEKALLANRTVRKADKPASGKARVKITAQGRKVSYGQAGNAKDGGPRVRPGTSKGDAYCARSAGQMRANPKAARNPNSPLRLSRARWRCSGENSVKKTGENALSPILFEAVAKARRSLPDPQVSHKWRRLSQSEAAMVSAQENRAFREGDLYRVKRRDATMGDVARAYDRRADRYQRFADAKGRSSGRKARQEIAQIEATRARLRAKEIRTPYHDADGKRARGALASEQKALIERRANLEAQRAKAASAARRKQDKNNDGYPDGLKPKGAKPRKTATERPTFSVNDVYGRGGNDAVYASIKDMRFSELKALIQQEGLRANLPAPRTAADARKYIQVAAKETYGRRGDPIGRLAGNERTSSDPVRQAVRDATAKRPSRVKAEAAMSLGVEDITPNATRAGEQVGAKVSDAKANVMAISRLDAASLRQMAKDNPSTLNWAIEAKMTLPQMRRVHRSLTGQKLSDLAGFSDHQQAIRAALPDMGRAGRMQVKQKPIRKGATVVMSPILSEAVAKAARSLNAPKNKKQAKRRAALYDRVAQAGNPLTASIAQMEAARQRAFAETGKYGRGQTTGREARNSANERRRSFDAQGRKRRNDKNNDGWIDGQKPAGAKPRKTAQKLPKQPPYEYETQEQTVARNQAALEVEPPSKKLPAAKKALAKARRELRRAEADFDALPSGFSPWASIERYEAVRNARDAAIANEYAAQSKIWRMHGERIERGRAKLGLPPYKRPRDAGPNPKFLSSTTATQDVGIWTVHPKAMPAQNKREEAEKPRSVMGETDAFAAKRPSRVKAEAAGPKSKAERKRASEQQRAKFRMEWSDLPTPDKTGVGSADDKFGRESARYRREEAEVERMKGERARVQERIDRAMSGKTHKPSTGWGSAPPYMSDRERQDRMAKPRMTTTDADREVLARLRALTPKHQQMIRDQTAGLDEDTRNGILDYYGMLDRYDRRRYRERSGKIKKSAALHDAVVYTHVARINKALRALAA